MSSITPSVAKCLRLASQSGKQAGSLALRSLSLLELQSPLGSTESGRRQLSSTPVVRPSTESERLFASVVLTVKGSDEAVLDSYTQFVTRAATIMNLDITGRVIVPMNIEKRTLLASPHIFKKARVQYELRTHGRMVQINKLTGDTADVFLEYIQRNLPEGISMSVEQEQVEALPDFLKTQTTSTDEAASSTGEA